MSVNVSKIIKKAEQTCSDNAVRLTQKRRQVLEVLLRQDQPKSAYEIADLYQKTTEQSMPAMSIYRILDFLIDMKLVHKLSSTNKFMACKHITCEHEHSRYQFLICDQCKTVIEIDLDKKLLNALDKSVEKHHFSLISTQLELHGICESCHSA